MKRLAYITAGATASGQYSNTVDLSGYANASGDGKRCMKMKWWVSYNDGTVAAVACEHDTDPAFGTTADLWEIATGDLSSAADQERVVYTWKPYNRVSFGYTQGSSTRDKGCRVIVEYDVWGLPDWENVQVCRWEDVEALRANLTDSSLDFQSVWNDHERLAKRAIAHKLRGRGIDPDRVFTDGHEETPVIEGMETAGAALTCWYVLNGYARKSEGIVADMEALWAMFNEDFNSACTGGLAIADVSGDTEPTQEDTSPKRARIIY